VTCRPLLLDVSFVHRTLHYSGELFTLLYELAGHCAELGAQLVQQVVYHVDKICRLRFWHWLWEKQSVSIVPMYDLVHERKEGILQWASLAH
jgi:hypothetical protein